jgi:phosphoribosylamine-glycine ligase
MGIDTLVVGSGGREHALAWKLAQSPRVGRLYAAPGNPGLAALGECVPLKVGQHEELVRFAREKEIGLAVIGPEVPLAEGLGDRLREAGIRVFGPSARAARIESSKSYAREIMTRAGVPQPAYARFTDFDAAAAYLDQLSAEGATGAVVKASGLAAGKGAVVCQALAEARETARQMLVDRTFGESGAEIVIEELLVGEEVSLLVLTDGVRALPLLPAQDYKRAYNDDRGPNTGGMGCYAPAPLLTPQERDQVMDTIILPTLRALAEDGAPFQGCLYAGLIKTSPPTGQNRPKPATASFASSPLPAGEGPGEGSLAEPAKTGKNRQNAVDVGNEVSPQHWGTGGVSSHTGQNRPESATNPESLNARTPERPDYRVIEFNCRFGDPEAQVVLPLLESDLLELFLGAAEGRLPDAPLCWKDARAVTVVLASGGYPGHYETGRTIHGIPEAEGLEGVTVFHAGTARNGSELVTAGGRVLNVTGVGKSFSEAIDRAYAGVERITFEGREYRTDIAARVRREP